MDRTVTFEHGTRQGYRVHGCTCQECRAWNARRMKDYRDRKLAAGWKISHGRIYLPEPRHIVEGP